MVDNRGVGDCRSGDRHVCAGGSGAGTGGGHAGRGAGRGRAYGFSTDACSGGSARTGARRAGAIDAGSRAGRAVV